MKQLFPALWIIPNTISCPQTNICLSIYMCPLPISSDQATGGDRVYNVTYPAEKLHGISGLSEDGEITGLTKTTSFPGLYEGPEIRPCCMIGQGGGLPIPISSLVAS